MLRLGIERELLLHHWSPDWLACTSTNWSSVVLELPAMVVPFPEYVATI